MVCGEIGNISDSGADTVFDWERPRFWGEGGLGLGSTGCKNLDRCMLRTRGRSIGVRMLTPRSAIPTKIVDPDD